MQENISFLLFQLELEKNIRSIEELSKSVSQEQSIDSDCGCEYLWLYSLHLNPVVELTHWNIGNYQVWQGRAALCWEVEPREGLPQPRNTQPSAKQVMHIKDKAFKNISSSADHPVGPLIRTQEGRVG